MTMQSLLFLETFDPSDDAVEDFLDERADCSPAFFLEARLLVRFPFPILQVALSPFEEAFWIEGDFFFLGENTTRSITTC